MLITLALAGCGGVEELEPIPPAPPAPPSAQTDRSELPLAEAEVQSNGVPDGLPPTVVAASERLVAIGDVHGDLPALRAVLRIAELVDEDDHWSGGAAVLVQVGDVLDRGDDEERILELFERLAVEASEAGGAVYVLLGNHELMNARGDFRYVTEGGWRDFADTAHDTDDPSLARYPASHRGRVAAFRPGGEWARRLAAHNLVMVVGDTVLVHGGVLPEHVEHGLENLNRETRRYLLGEGPLPALLMRVDSPHWSRHYSQGTDAADCALLSDVLSDLSAQRMVVAHTPFVQGIGTACDGRVFRIDVGMARHYGGRRQALEITSEGARVLEAR